VLLAVELIVLLVTGVELARTYRPTASRAWDDLVLLGPGFTRVERLRDVHALASTAAIVTAVAGAVLALASAIETKVRVVGRAVTGPVLAVLVAAVSFTGRSLPWDQLALRSVTVGTNMYGYWFVTDRDDVRFVLVDGAEVSAATFARAFWSHTTVLPLAVVALGVLLLVVLRRPARVAPEEGEQAVLG